MLLIHGIKDDERKMQRMAEHLRAEGWAAHTMSLVPSWGQLGLDELAAQVRAFVERTFPSGQRFDLVGFSMGGLVSRYYLQRLGGLKRVDRFITISTPHNGSILAWLIPNAGCRQMRPGSGFLRDLASDVARLGQLRFTSIWTPLDLVILPAWSSVLPVGESRQIWCAAHPLMVWEKRCLREVANALAGS